MSHRPKSLTAPIVKAFYSTKCNLPIAVTRIELACPDASDAILDRESDDNWNFPHLDVRWTGALTDR